MEWLQPTSENLIEGYDEPQGKLDIDRVESKQITTNTIISDFFVMLNCLGERTVSQLPAPDDKVYHRIMEEIAPYFERILIIKINNQIIEVSLQHVKKEALTILNNKAVHPVLDEFFHGEADKSGYNLFGQVPNRSVYKVLPHFIDPLEDPEVQQLFDFLKEMCSVTKDFGFILKPWLLSDELKQLQAIRFAAHYCQDVYLWVDNDTERIFEIQFKF
ncbi:hypothetical protein SAMN05421736_12726 [Evansella caseinilytica]|uniref:Uncharacterized protein n=1 Tax=Evansella caseinilytica TaxID=1503961 RepID=A0A1H3UVL6_9BACI|nr:hypothetical protein [Evansella caseinilytica]SDZ66378.1 hypothetical protein SAMN05421736_12726 [Evansella caseinilytica]